MSSENLELCKSSVEMQHEQLLEQVGKKIEKVEAKIEKTHYVLEQTTTSLSSAMQSVAQKFELGLGSVEVSKKVTARLWAHSWRSNRIRRRTSWPISPLRCA